MSSSVINPILVRQLPSLPPLARWNSRAFWSWSCVIRLSLTSISPRRTDIRSTPSKGLHPSPTLTKDDEERSQNFVCRFEMANTVRTGRFFHAGTGGNLDLLPQDAILPERCASVHRERVFARLGVDGKSRRGAMQRNTAAAPDSP